MITAIKSTISNLMIYLPSDNIASSEIDGDGRKRFIPFVKNMGFKQKSFVLTGFGLITCKLRSDNGNIHTIEHSEITGTGAEITKIKLKSPIQKILPQELNVYVGYLSNHLCFRSFPIIRKAIYSHV